MTIIFGVLVWLLLIAFILKFFAVTSEIKRTYHDYEGKMYTMMCPCGSTIEVSHLKWDSIKCPECGAYYNKKEFRIK
tara:strand:- start:13681 stop:13911 length:231 start_codon:yes stop_codon:yes gene_type:complete